MAEIQTWKGYIAEIKGDRRGDGSFDEMVIITPDGPFDCRGDIPRGVAEPVERGAPMVVEVVGTESRGRIRVRSVMPIAPYDAETLGVVAAVDPVDALGPAGEPYGKLAPLFEGHDDSDEACFAIYGEAEAAFRRTGIPAPRSAADNFTEYFRNVTAMALLRDKGRLAEETVVELSAQVNLAAVLHRNPYELVKDLRVGFKEIDRVGEYVGIAADDQRRLGGLMLDGVKQDLRDGHCYTPRKMLFDRMADKLGDEPNTVLEAAVASKMLVVEEDRIYLPGVLQAEQQVAENLAFKAAMPKVAIDPRRLAEIVDAVAVNEKTGAALNKEQREMVRSFLVEPLTQVTGGPGTGKTTSIEAAVKAARMQNPRVRIRAFTPSATAAERVNAIMGEPIAETIQLALGQRPDGSFARGAHEPLPDYDIVLVDEWSMGDLRLMRAFMNALPAKTRLMFVGHPGHDDLIGQLPSIDAGKVFTDMVDAGVGKVVHFTESYRSGSNRNLIDGVRAIERGEMPPLPRTMQGGVLFLPTPSADVADVLTEIYEDGLSEMGISPAQCQIIAPMRVSPTGTAEINRVMQDVLNPNGMSLESWWDGPASRRDCIPRIGDPVLQRENVKVAGSEPGKEQRFSNGQTGILAAYDSKRDEVRVDFDNGTSRYYPPHRAVRELEVRYAETGHKMQGHEAEAVVLVVTPDHRHMLEAENFLVSWSRAKKFLIVVGSEDAIRVAVTTSHTKERRTTLCERIQAACQGLTLVEAHQRRDGQEGQQAPALMLA